MGHPPKVMPCELVSWQQVHQLSRTLAYAIHAQGFRPDIIIAIGRGGFVPARILADYLDSMALTSIKVEHYRRGAEKQALARVTYPLCHDIAGQQVLLVDDVSDTGDTYVVALDHLSQWNPAQVVTTALHHKVVSSYEPDLYAERVTQWRWLIYPWAVLEDLSSFIDKMEPPPGSLGELRRRLREDYGIEPAPDLIEDALTLILEKKIPS
jgi:hypoxanthine phosphoribosyltransferase